MTELLEKSIQTLELPRVLAMLADEAVTEEGKEVCRKVRPQTLVPDVARLQKQTSAAFQMLVKHGTPSFSGVRPVSAALQRADRGGSLNTRELLDIAQVLRCARSVREYGVGESTEKTVLDGYFHSLSPNRFLEEKISGSILSEDEIADSASPELADIRRHIRAAAGKVRDVLNRLISSNQSKYLQESIITMRGGRYVVPVKSEHKNEIPGLVHDVSGSGGTFFIEPMGVVNANNELRELQMKEQKEIERILAELSADCAGFREGIEDNYRTLIALDVIFARAKLSTHMGGMEPVLGDFIELKKARHPLLDPKTAVRNDLYLGKEFDTLVITGPNTGGKTVTLKTLGLLTLMAQCGLHIPAMDGSTIRVCSAVLADIGDEQSIDQSLSTFSSHMTNIVAMLEQLDDTTLVLFDELGAGTDPVEGAALAAAIIESARQLGARVAATTHYAELKVYAMTTEGVENASCEFDVDTLGPTYRVLIGIPGKSNAFAISRRLGLPDYIIQRAAERIDAENVRFEDVISQLERQRQAMEKEKELAQELRRDMERTKAEADRYRERIEEERRKATEKAQAEARAIIQEARDTADAVFKELNAMRRRQEKAKEWVDDNQQRSDLRRTLNEAENALGADHQDMESPAPTRPAVMGDMVEVLKTRTQAQVVGVNKDGTLQLQAGILKMKAKQEEVRVLEEATVRHKQSQKDKARKAAVTRPFRAAAAKAELDLRGMMVDEALAAVDQFLDNALMGKLETVTIIHGKGTGALRKAVREHLKHSRYVKSARPGAYGEGEDGVTIATLR
ncbi:endonuclease MutS2 [Pseudoflavonifractor capillosus]|uniref:endonuclease MutS2 n=1 Tax=Pseudoflavonifractor capillosus TaxID=106588 RepID=UPI001958C4B1|nr:endonuclease MutS2 [Pseudoflavonifractor capillosus]MBM6896139.1 endonuclease MutS2 [Pseudoflavonifractor capillosus]